MDGVYFADMLLLDAKTEEEALNLRMQLYAQDKKDGCYEPGCYDVRKQ